MKTDRSSLTNDDKPTQSVKAQIDSICGFAQKRVDESTQQMLPALQKEADSMGKLQWLRKLIAVLINSKENLEELLSRKEEAECGQYEESLQQLEAQVRKHVANEQAMKIHMDSLQESINEMQSQKWKLVSELDRLNKKKKKVEEEPLRELKTTRVRSSSSNILVRERSRLKSRQKATETSKENSNMLNTNGSVMNLKKQLHKHKEAGRIRGCR